MTYVVGSTKIDGWYLAAYRPLDGAITYPQWSSDRKDAASFTEHQRETLRLPFGGCWVRAISAGPVLDMIQDIYDDYERAQRPAFDTASEADEVTL